MKKILTVVGTRPNFIKITQFEKEFAKYPEEFEFRLLHTGQHYDTNMSDVFFQQLQIRKPDYHLGVEGGLPGEQMGKIILGLTEVISEWQPDLIMAPGDVNSTLAAAIAANKAGIPLAHIESGLRSRDRGMPEEINRILTDEISDILLITEQSGWDNLIAEGKEEAKMAFVGNTMIDTLLAFQPDIDASPIREKLKVSTGQYVLMTMHRPATVDNEEGLIKMLGIIDFITESQTIVFPIHPRTVARLKSHNLWQRLEGNPNLRLSEPMDYFSFQHLIKNSAFVLTDSGGIQEETTYYQVPCITLRPNTERPSTITLGSNILMPLDIDKITAHISQIRSGDLPKGNIPPKWDGKASQRIVEYLRSGI